MKKLKIELNFEEIRQIPTNQFKEMIRRKCKETAFEYLLKKRSFKGGEIKYDRIETANYLMPNNELTIEQKLKIFSIRNKMLNIPSNFVSRENNTSKCICKQREDMEHLYECEFLNETTIEIKYEEIYGDNIKLQKKILTRFENSLIMRNIKESQISHVIPFGDPPSSVIIGCGNG